MLRSIRHRFKPQEVSRELGALAGKDMEELTSDDILAIRGVYRRFRVLVLGPANAGKTTLLERLSDSPAGAATVTRDGRRIPEVPRGYSQRGAHRITDEITYASNPGFVFHDSGGFEAGADDEIKAVWNFIRKRSSGSPSEQLHAIWLCIPADNSRPFGFLHSGFFSKPTGSVPVIGVFTKLDGRETIELVNLLGADPSPSDIFQSHSRVQQRTTNFIEELQTQFQRLPVPPTAFIRLGNMHKNTEESTAACTQLLQITTDALPTGTLKLLLRITVRNKLRRVKTTTMLQRVLKEAEVQGNIVEGTINFRGIQGSELFGDKARWALWRWFLYSLEEVVWGGRDYVLRVCEPLLTLSEQLASNPQIQYLTFVCLVILRIQRSKPTDLPDPGQIEHTASSIRAQIEGEFMERGNGQMNLDLGRMARRLAEIIDEFTPLDV